MSLVLPVDMHFLRCDDILLLFVPSSLDKVPNSLELRPQKRQPPIFSHQAEDSFLSHHNVLNSQLVVLVVFRTIVAPEWRGRFLLDAFLSEPNLSQEARTPCVIDLIRMRENNPLQDLPSINREFALQAFRLECRWADLKQLNHRCCSYG